MDWIEYLVFINDIINKKSLEAFLVGGALRDIILDRSIRDIDIVINERAAETARYFADKIGAAFVVLDKEREFYRVVKKNLYFDFAVMVGGDILEDLNKRDFTINAMALPMGTKGAFDKVINSYLIDPSNGLRDLNEKKIRINNEHVFLKDPLRLWRAVRLSGELNFIIEEKTADIMKRDKSLAAKPAPERIREELIKIMKLKKTVDIVKYMEREFGLLSSIIPEIKEMKTNGQNKYHQESSWEHSLQVLDEIEEILSIKKYREFVEEKEEPLLKLTALLHDIGKIKTKSINNGEVHYYGHELKGAEMLGRILKNLKFSRDEISFIRRLVQYHMRPMYLYKADKLTEKGKYRFFKQAGSLIPLILIHSLADKVAAMKGNGRNDEISGYHCFIDNMLKIYKIYKIRIDTLYLNGNDIIDILELEEGPYIGELMDKLSVAQGSGKINSRDEAIAFLKKIHN